MDENELNEIERKQRFEIPEVDVPHDPVILLVAEVRTLRNALTQAQELIKVLGQAKDDHWQQETWKKLDAIVRAALLQIH